MFLGFVGSPSDFFGFWFLPSFDHPSYSKSGVPPLGCLGKMTRRGTVTLPFFWETFIFPSSLLFFLASFYLSQSPGQEPVMERQYIEQVQGEPIAPHALANHKSGGRSRIQRGLQPPLWKVVIIFFSLDALLFGPSSMSTPYRYHLCLCHTN